MGRLSFTLKKIMEKNNMGFYKVSGSSIEKIFYIGINQPKQELYIYLSEDFTKPNMTIDPISTPIPEVGSISRDVVAPVLARSLEILNLDYYPEGVSYAG